MDRNIHFERMRETSRSVIPIIKEVYSGMGLSNRQLHDSLDFFVSMRTNKEQCLLRPYFVRLGYELSGKSDWTRIAPACAAIEMFNISTYQSNLSFDSKVGISSSSQKNNQFIASMISLDLSIDTIYQLRAHFDKSVISQIIERVHETNRNIYLGQFYDLNQLTISDLDLSMTEEQFLTEYIKRCEKLGGTLTSLCFEVGALLGGADNRSIDTLKRIGVLMGTAGQIVNDLSDYASVNDNDIGINVYKPYYCDLRAGKITYPLFHLLKELPIDKQKVIIDLLNDRNHPNYSNINDVSLWICRYSSLKSVRSIVWRYYKALRKEIRTLEKSYYRDLLSLASSSLLTNKYFAILRKYGEDCHVG